MTDREKIKAEIGITLLHCSSYPYSLEPSKVLQDILSYINSLPENPISDDLGKAARKYESEQQEKHKDRNNRDFDNYRDGFVDGLTFTYDAFIVGAQWNQDRIAKVLLSKVLPYFVHGEVADKIVAKLDEVLSSL